MSSTRRANKRARLARRAENDAMRDARREALFIILSRAQRGRPLTEDEAAQLRVAVEAEIREGDTARASERGQQRAMEEHRQRVEAADEAIRELEQRAEAAERMVGILDAVDQGRAHGAQRIMDERDQAQQRAEQAEAEVEGYRAAEKYRQAAADTLAGRLDAIRQQTAEGLVEGFEELTKRAEQAERQRDDLAAELKQRTEADSADAAAGSYAARAEAAEARLDEQRRRADYRGAQLADALHRADTYRAAWHSARDRARKATRRSDIWKAKAYEIEQDRDRLAAELPLTAVPTRRPEVITDRATIRNTLDEPEPVAPCPCNGVCHECDDSLCDACAPARP